MQTTTIRSAIFAACILCAVVVAYAQCPEAGDLNITSTLYTQENGLSSNMLVNIAKDSTGFRYFLGVNGRWLRYDGVNFSSHYYPANIASDRFALLAEDNDNIIEQYEDNILYKLYTGQKDNFKWAIIKDSLIRIDISKNKRASFALPDEIAENKLTAFFPQGELCWITVFDKVFCFQSATQTFREIWSDLLSEKNMPSNYSRQIVFDVHVTAFIISQKQVLKLNKLTLLPERVCTLSKDPGPIPLMALVMNEFLFIAGKNSVISEVDLQSGAIKEIDLVNYTGIGNERALKITEIKNYQNYLLIGTSNTGMLIYNRCTDKMQSFQYEKKDVDRERINSIVWIVPDKENVIWLQTEGGLIKLEVNKQSMETYLPSAFSHNGLCNNCDNVRSIFSLNDSSMLVGTLEGLFSFNPYTYQFRNLQSPETAQPVWPEVAISSMTGDGRENIFIGSWGDEGILLLNKKKKSLVNILPSEEALRYNYRYIRCLFYDSHHALWIGTDNTLLRIPDLDVFIENNFTGKLNIINGIGTDQHTISIQDYFCFSITEDTLGNVWLGTTDGIYVYNYNDKQIIKYAHIENDNTSLRDNEVRCFYISKDNDIWIGTNNGGLNHFDADTKTFTSFTTENGLSNNSIYTIAEDKNGYLWLGTNGGLCRFNKTDHSVRNYTPRDGIQNFEFNTNALCATADGRFCFGGRTGFNIFHPDSMNAAFAPPQVIITKFKIFDKEFPVNNNVLHLTHDQNSFSFDFATLNYFRSSDNQYSYMLEGADKEWIKAGNRQYTSYANLPPGTYTFKVKAANYTGMWNENLTTMQFIIRPAWYNTWWFSTGIIIIIALSIYSFYRYRLRHIQKLQFIRNRIASDLHDEIGSTLSSISLSSTIIQNKLKGENTEISKMLQQVSNNTDDMMESLSDIVWAINTENDRFDNVVNRMRAFAAELLEPAGIKMHFQAADDMLSLHPDMQKRKNLYLIFKEALNNSIKYAEAKNIYIIISRQDKRNLIMDISDDGKGFLPEAQEEKNSLSGNGIRNMKNRAKEMGGTLQIDSAPGKGTLVHLIFAV